MRTSIFAFILITLVLCIIPYTCTKTSKTTYEDTLDAYRPPVSKDTTVIGSTIEMFESFKWSKEELERYETYDTIDGVPIVIEPYILIKEAEREFDTIVNHCHIYFTTRAD